MDNSNVDGTGNSHSSLPDYSGYAQLLEIQELPKKKLTEEELGKYTDRLRLENDYLVQRVARRLYESWWFDGFGGTDEFYRLRSQAGGQAGWLPMTVPSDRRGGAKWPIWRTEQELNNLRQESRVLADSNAFCQGLLTNLTNFIIGKGYTYAVQIKKEIFEQELAKLKQVQKQQQQMQAAKQQMMQQAQAGTPTQSVNPPSGGNPLQHQPLSGGNGPPEKKSPVQEGLPPPPQPSNAHQDQGNSNPHKPPQNSQQSADHQSQHSPPSGGDSKPPQVSQGQPQQQPPQPQGPPPTPPEEMLEEKFRPIVTKFQMFLDDFLTRNQWNNAGDPLNDSQTVSATKEREIHRRVYRDGEALLQFYYHTDRNDTRFGKTDVRFIDPECVRQPPGKTLQDGWSFGRKHQTDPYVDYTVIEEWYVLYHETDTNHNHPMEPTTQGVFMDASEMLQIKSLNEDAETARGTPAFTFERGAALRRASLIQRHVSQTASVRAAWAEIWKHVTGDRNTVQQFAAGLSTQNTSSPSGQPAQGDLFPWGQRGGGRTRHVSQGMEPVNPPGSTGVTEHMDAQQGDLRQACSSLCAPEYMAGSTNDANYATASEAGVPFVRNGEAEQEYFKGAFLRAIWRAVRFAIACGQLPPEVLKICEIQAEATQIQKNNEGELTAKNRAMNEAGVLSPDAWAMQEGLDPDEQDRYFQKRGRKFGETMEQMLARQQQDQQAQMQGMQVGFHAGVGMGYQSAGLAAPKILGYDTIGRHHWIRQGGGVTEPKDSAHLGYVGKHQIQEEITLLGKHLAYLQESLQKIYEDDKTNK